jgi:hypothetical protein
MIPELLGLMEATSNDGLGSPWAREPLGIMIGNMAASNNNNILPDFIPTPLLALLSFLPEQMRFPPLLPAECPKCSPKLCREIY